MVTEVIVPKLGMSEEPIMLIEWKANEGEKVEKGSVVLIVETEKIRHDVEAEASGFIHILTEAGQESPIGTVAALLAETETELSELQQGGAPTEAPAAAEAAVPAEAPAVEATPAVSGAGTEVIVPKLGMSTEPIMLIEWKAKEGEKVEKGSVVLIVETEKIRHDVEAEASGYLHIVMEAGQEAEIGSVAAVITETKEGADSASAKAVPAAAKATPPAPSPAKTTGDRVLISPLARKIAEANMIDISRITGSGPGGRIVREDVENAIVAKATPATASPTAAPDYQGRAVKEKLPLGGMRKAIAEHMHHSLSVAAQLTAMGEIDVEKLVAVRKKLVAKEKKLGTRITYTDIMVAAVAAALKEHPLVNASLMGNEIVQWDDINVSVAVATEEGLIVPVVKHADEKSLVEISKEVKSLAKRGREGALGPADIQGGTFTITNLGALGGGYRFETVIINQPESAILGTGGITDRAVVRDGKIVIRPIMTYYLTYDHRVFTGAVAASFMDSLIGLLADPDSFIDV